MEVSSIRKSEGLSSSGGLDWKYLTLLFMAWLTLWNKDAGLGWILGRLGIDLLLDLFNGEWLLRLWLY
jgi:hypothetical protein